MLQGTVRNALTITLKDVQKTKTGTRFNIPTLHGLRKYFNVTLKSRANSNLSLCEKLMGHSVTIPLDNHYAPFSDDALFEEYKKAILDLTISNEDRQRQEIESSKKEIESLNKEKSQWEKERTEREYKYAKRIKEEILRELNDPNNSGKSLKEQLENNRKQSKQIKKDVGLE